jgi:DNA-binding response OmpR family regulator
MAFGLRFEAALPRRAAPARFLRTNMTTRSTPAAGSLRAKFRLNVAQSADFRGYHRFVLSEVDQIGGRVLIVEDDVEIADVLRRSLRNEGYEVRTSADGIEALDVAAGFVPDVVVLDLGLPGMDGVEVCRRLRSDGDVPILMLTARSETEDRVTGLDSGADDYLVKPFERKELLARIRALLRRRPPRGAASLEVGDLVLNPDTREVHRGEREIELTNREFELLEFLMRNERLVVSRERLLDEVWGYDPMAATNTIDVFISNLRRKLEAGGEGRLLHTKRGAGYVLKA